MSGESSGEPRGALRAMLDPDEYLGIVGAPLPGMIFGKRSAGVGGNESLRKAFGRATSARGYSWAAFEKAINWVSKAFPVQFKTVPIITSEAITLGSWSILEHPDIKKAAPKAAAKAVEFWRDAEKLEAISKSGDHLAFAAGLRKLGWPGAGALLEEAARGIETSNSGEYKAALAPVHLYVLNFIALLFMMEAADPAVDEALPRDIVYGRDDSGPAHAIGRFFQTLRHGISAPIGYPSNSSYVTKKLTLAQLANLMFNSSGEKELKETSRVLHGRRRPPLLTGHSWLLKWASGQSGNPVPESVLIRLELGLFYSTIVARSAESLENSGCRAEQVESTFIAALEGIEISRNLKVGTLSGRCD